MTSNLPIKSRKIKFGDVVRLSKARCADPLDEGIERFVGLEHLEPGDLRIRNWGNVADGVTFTSVFKPGQVLFGKRRAYQRKVAVADFSGVCSGDIYVFECIDANVLLPELLPFICQTDAFFDHAVSTSAGSLSPRTNWTSLAKFEFMLPSLAEQKLLLRTLGATDDLLDSLEFGVAKAWELLRSALAQFFNTGNDPLRTPSHSQWSCHPLLEFITVKHGWAFKGEFFSEDANEGPLLLTPSNFTEFGSFDFRSERNKYYTGEFPEDYWLNEGDLLLLMTDLTPSAKLLGAPGVIKDGERSLHNQRLGKVLLKNGVISDTVLFKNYLFFFFMSEPFRRQIRALSAGSTVSHTSPTQICRVAIPLPSEHEQRKLVDQLTEIHSGLDSLKDRRTSAQLLARKFREQALGVKNV